jgi:hypothetical protein
MSEGSHVQEIVTRLSKQTSLATWDNEPGHGLGDAPAAAGADQPNEPALCAGVSSSNITPASR